eukprot:01791.XXX_5495_5866_1 [CDS] Oithona nana genome sequencing.
MERGLSEWTLAFAVTRPVLPSSVNTYMHAAIATSEESQYPWIPMTFPSTTCRGILRSLRSFNWSVHSFVSFAKSSGKLSSHVMPFDHIFCRINLATIRNGQMNPNGSNCPARTCKNSRLVLIL